MVIDKKLNLDKELEYFPDGGLAFAQNIVIGEDGLTIQNEPAIVNVIKSNNIDVVGFVACNKEYILFDSKSKIYRVAEDGNYKLVDIKWQWQGGEVFGTYTYNVNKELIISISERNLPKDVDCPLKVINIDRDVSLKHIDDNIYTLTPNIPKGNLIDVEYITGNRIKKGKYNFFIKYFIDDDYETTWFPIGIPVFLYDNVSSDKSKIIDSESIQAIGELSDTGVPKDYQYYRIIYDDFYNNDDEYIDNNVILTFKIDDVTNYTHYKIGYIINAGTNIEARQTVKQLMINNKIKIDDYSETISVDELTINIFNIYNVNTLCNYKDRLYLANYKEENRNAHLEDVDTSQIKVYYDPDEYSIPSVIWSNDDNEKNFAALKNQWKSKPGRFGIYNFYIHYVYPNGNFTDGIKIGVLDTYKYKLLLGEILYIDVYAQPPQFTETVKHYITLTKTSTTNDVIAEVNKMYVEHYPYEDDVLNLGVPSTFKVTSGLIDFCNEYKDRLWHEVSYLWDSGIPATVANTDIELDTPENLVELEGYTNSKGDVLFKMPFDAPVNTKKLYFKGIKMYPQFVGYFISYENPEYVQIGEGFIVPQYSEITESGVSIPSKDLFDLNAYTPFNKLKFYYPEFNIIGGKVNGVTLVRTGKHSANATNVHVDTKVANGITLEHNNFSETGEVIRVKSAEIISPSTFNNIGKEGYLRINLNEDIQPEREGNNMISYTLINNDLNIYLSDIKKLVSLGFVKYQQYNSESPNATYNYGFEDVPYNYDFYRCFSSIVFFKGNGIIINQTESNHVASNTGIGYYSSDHEFPTSLPHIGIVKYWHETHYPLFLKEIHQSPETLFHSNYKMYVKSVEGELVESGISGEQYQSKSLVINPNYVNDLYKLNPVYYEYTGKIITNYDKKAIFNNIDRYTKTIRRSDVIQSESVINSWRYFRPDNYKIITENKGEITNIIGIGNYLFAHCEHSLFLFDVTDSLQTIDKNVQLLQPDSFDVAYKEVFTADKGYGGLQDNVSWICDEFGYIFFDKSAKKIYRYDGGQLKDVTEDISSFIKYFDPQQIWMGNDRPRNRVMMNFRGADNSVMFSYNLSAGGWTSTHSYISNYKFISLKDKLFILNNSSSGVIVASYDVNNFNSFSLPVGEIDNNGTSKSFIDVVFTNPNYNKIKVLDFITYILNKEPNDKFEILQLEIYTNCCYSGVIDISQERKSVKDYNKPYYDYERWNFNYFRNRIDKIQNGDIVHRLTGVKKDIAEKVQRGYDNALISGKYVVLRFSFKNTTKKVEIKDIHAYFKP